MRFAVFDGEEEYRMKTLILMRHSTITNKTEGFALGLIC